MFLFFSPSGKVIIFASLHCDAIALEYSSGTPESVTTATFLSRLKSVAGIKKDIVTVGRGKRLEIWSAENYDAYINGLDYDAEFKSLGI